MDGKGQKHAEAKNITGQSDAAVAPFLIFGGVWQWMQLAPYGQLHGWHQMRYCAGPSWQRNVVQAESPSIEAPEAGLPQQAEQQSIPQQQQ